MSDLIKRLEEATQWDDSPSWLIHGAIARIATLEARLDEAKKALELARAVLAQSITAGHNVPGPTPEDIEKAFWTLDAALNALEGGE